MPQYYLMTLQYVFENIPPKAMCALLGVQVLPFRNCWP